MSPPRPRSLIRVSGTLFAALFLLLAATPAIALPPPYVVEGPLQSVPITVYSEYLHDPRDNLTLESVRAQRLDERFVPASGKLERLGFIDGVVWLRFAIRNATDEPGEWVLELSPGIVSELDFYHPHSDGYRVSRSGFSRDRPWGDMRHRNQLLRIELEPRTTGVFYMRVEPGHDFSYSLRLNNENHQLRAAVSGDVFYLLLAGLVLGLVLYNLGLFLTGSEQIHAWYAAFLTFLTLAALTSAGFTGLQYFFQPDLLPWLESASVLLALAGNTLFSALFLRIPERLPALQPYLRGLALMLAVAGLSSWLLPARISLQLTWLLTAFLTPALLWLGIVCWQRNIAEAPLYVLARLPLTVLILIVALTLFGWLNLQIFFPLLVLVAAAMEALLFAVGLQRKAERELRQQLARSQRKDMESTVQEVRHNTLARMSHEIRTPMSGIMGMAEILEDTPLTPNQREYVRAIRGAGENLLESVNEVLEQSHSGEDTNTTGRINRESFDLGDIVMEALDLFRERAEEKEIELITHVHTNVPVMVEGDRSRLRQVMTNLLACNIRHGHPGELMIDVARDPAGRSHHLRFEFTGSSLRDAWTALSVLENHADPASSDSTTLGLSIARQLVEAMDGRLLLRKDRHRHPVCSFSLPLPEAREEQPRTVDTSILQGRTMLVVDDSSTVTRVIRQQALSWGMRVTVSHDPQEALATIRTQANINQPFDVVVLDHLMPGTNGMQLAARIHEDPVITHPLILIMLTGVQAAPSATTAHNVGIHRILAKPVSGAQLRLAVAEELSRQQRQAGGDTIPTTPDPGVRLLVAEDHQLSQKVIRGMLAKLGLEADMVANGHEALNALDKQRYDLILMDCEMPEMDGFEATRQIRAREYEQGLPPVPIIALTAHILREHKERALAAGMNAHLSKPVELDELGEMIVRFTRDPAARPPD